MSSENESVPRTEHISVIGAATYDVEPDLIVVTFSLNRVAQTMGLAKQDVDDRCARVIQLARDVGIVNADITATQLSLAPHREYRNGEWLDKGYKAERNVTLKLRDISRFNQLIGDLVSIPIDRVVKIDRQILNRSAAEQVALGKAVSDGKGKGDFLASQLGVSLGRVYSVRICAQDTPRVHALFAYGGGARASNEDATFEPGTIEIKASVDITFYIDRPQQSA